MRSRRLAILAAFGLAATALPHHVAEANSVDNQALRDFGTGDAIGTGAHTTLKRSADAVAVGVHSRGLEPGHAYTVWLAIFNTPDGCATAPCAEPDLFNPAATPSVIWSGVGGIANPAGALNGSGMLSEGNAEGYQQLFTDTAAAGTLDRGFPDPGFLDAEGAEIHFVVRDHGPDTGDPDQTSTFEGDCTPPSSIGLGAGAFECVDVQFSINEA